MIEKLTPDVQRLIAPIVNRMTAVYLQESMYPVIGHQKGNDPNKQLKQECVHFIMNGSAPECALVRTADDKLKCKACGREIAINFDGTNVETLLAARKVVEQVMFFGMINKLNKDYIAACIDIKKALPVVAQLASELNDFVKRENADADTVSNLGAEYRQAQGFTAMY